MEKFLDVDFGANNGFGNSRQQNRFEKTQRMLRQCANEIDFENELIPYLNEEQKTVFKFYMYSMKYKTATQFNENEKLSKNVDDIANAITIIINKIIYKKNQIKELTKILGGENGVNDFKMFLKGNMLIYFNEVILNIDPFAIKKLPFEAKRVTFHNYNNAIKTKIKEILDKKERCKFFIEKNGGEDFLIHDFGSSLDMEDQSEIPPEFTILDYTLMDYHYQTITGISKNIFNEAPFYVSNTQKIVLRKLEQYKTRKSEIESLLEHVSAKQMTELINSMNKVKLEILYNYTLAYSPKSKVDLIKALNIKEHQLERYDNQILQSIYNLSKQNIRNLDKNNKKI